jgi:acyl-CoA thioesterase
MFCSPSLGLPFLYITLSKKVKLLFLESASMIYFNQVPLLNHLPEVSSMDEKKYLKKVRELTNRSPYYQLLKMETLEIRKGKSIIQMPFRKKLTHPYGIVHGGAIASLADSAVAMALIGLVKPSDRITTIEFKINFFTPVSQGKLTAQAKIIYKGSKTAVGDVEVSNEAGKLVAKVIATYMIQSTEEQFSRARLAKQ